MKKILNKIKNRCQFLQKNNLVRNILLNKEFIQRLGQKINIRLIDQLDLSTLCNASFREVINLITDLAEIDIRKDPEIQTSPDGYQLHKICQYTLQYLRHSINEISLQNEVLSEKTKIYDHKLEKQVDVTHEQLKKIEQLEEEIKELEECNEHEQYLIEQEKGLEAENSEKVSNLLDRLKQGLTGVDDKLGYVKEFKRSMVDAENKFNS